MDAPDKSTIIEAVFGDLGLIERTHEYASSVERATFPANAAEFSSKLRGWAEEQRNECNLIVQGLGGIPVKLEYEAVETTRITGIERFENGNWYFYYSVGGKPAEDKFSGTLERLREVYKATLDFAEDSQAE